MKPKSKKKSIRKIEIRGKEALDKGDYKQVFEIFSDVWLVESFEDTSLDELRSRLLSRACDIGLEEELQKAQIRLQEGHHEEAFNTFYDGWFYYAHIANVPIPQEVTDFMNRTYKYVLEDVIKETEETFAEGKYCLAVSSVRETINWAGKNKINITKGFLNFQKQAYQRGALGLLENAEEKLRQRKDADAGNSLDIGNSLNIAEGYAQEGGIDISERLKNLRKRQFEWFVIRYLKGARECLREEKAQACKAYDKLRFIEQYAEDRKIPPKLQRIVNRMYEILKRGLIKEATNKIADGYLYISDTPLEVLEDLYKKRFNEPVPQEVLDLRKEIERRIQEKESGLPLKRLLEKRVDIDDLQSFYSKRDGKEIKDVSDLSQARRDVEVALHNIKRMIPGDFIVYWLEDSGPSQRHGDIAEVTRTGFRLKESDQFISYAALRGLDMFPEVRDWTYEDRRDLKLVKKAELNIPSGKIIIIDPAYTKENHVIFNQDFMRRLREPAIMRLLYQDSPEKIAIIQGRKAVYLGNFGGDGDYPIVKTQAGLEILFDYDYEDMQHKSCKWDVIVDYKMILLADTTNITQINPIDFSGYSTNENSYDLRPGKYEISFQNTGKPRKQYKPNEKRGRIVSIEIL